MKDPNVELSLKYAREGHPSIEELATAQGVKLPQDIGELMSADFWPADEPLEQFLAFLDESRGRKRREPLA